MIQHHPSDATLAAFASGTLDEGRGLVGASHLARVRAMLRPCRVSRASAGSAGGDEPVGDCRRSACRAAMARLDRERHAHAGECPRGVVRQAGKCHDRCRGYTIGPWRWIGRGLKWRSVDVAVRRTRASCSRACPDRLPHHRHTGTEWTCAVQGAFTHHLGRYGAGDFDEADETVEHNPVVDEGEV